MNKLAVITGGTRGIGRALVERFAQGGCDVITCGRHATEHQSWSRELAQLTGVSVEILQADLSNRQGVKVLSDAVSSARRPVDVLINNAGYFLPGPMLTEGEGELEKLLQANLLSAYYLTKDLQEPVRLARGHIFNICSIASIQAYPSGGSYSVTKFALLGFSKSLREELKNSNVRVTAVLPGATLTDSWSGVDLPEERFMPPDDIAETIWSAWKLSGRSVVEEIVIRPQLGDI
ncbi:MAG: SDR family NAD(P)-dependent oxidoreductase [Cyclobacteriaceae bacterium]|nr:SDR family NAD(P)-dependent oxidoreductase [Cyclobacteriaceae bacterium]